MTRTPRIHICLIQPERDIFAAALLDPALYFYHQFKRLGASITLERNLLRRDAVNFIFGAHLGFDPAWLKQYSCIIVNLEQIGQGGAPVSAAYRDLLRMSISVDYDARNPAEYSAHPEDVPLVSFGYAEYLQPAEGQVLPLAERPVDVLFLGSVNERRLALIRRIEAAGKTVLVQQTPVFGSARDSILRQAKTLLNLHFYETARFEQVRAFISLSHGTPMLSERSLDGGVSPVFEACVTWLDEAFMDDFFGHEFGSPLFYEVMAQQLELFRQADPISEYAALLEFAAGVWQVKSGILLPGPSHRLIGPFFPAQLLPGEDSEFVRQVAKAAPSQPVPIFQRIDDIDHQIGQVIERNQPEMAVLLMQGTVSVHFHQPGILNHALYYPAFDRWIEVLAGKLADERVQAGAATSTAAPAADVNLIIATELYQIGGHSRLLEMLVRQLPNPVVVLTDIFGTFLQSPEEANWIRDRLPGVELLIIDTPNAWDKCRALADIVAARQPGCIWYLQHQQDAVAFIGSLLSGSSRKLMIHHADHNPSMGCTLSAVGHVDITDWVHKTCSHHLGRHCFRMPLCVPDHGARALPVQVPAVSDVSVVMAGRAGKFSLRGPLALQKIVEAALRVVGGRFYHIGELPKDGLSVIRQHLRAVGINPRRFVTKGTVPSLWDALKKLDAQIYIGSATASGGMSAIEAQGCGYPVLPHTGFDEGSMLADYSSYPGTDLGWRDTSELGSVLEAAVAQLPALSSRARQFYEQNFSDAVFAKCLRQLSQGEGASGHV